MNTIRAKCPNCWEISECSIEASNWSGQPISPAGQNAPRDESGRTGHNLRCPICHMTFWYEMRQAESSS